MSLRFANLLAQGDDFAWIARFGPVLVPIGNGSG